MSGSARRPRILHVHSTFDRGGAELLCVRLINAFADADHAVVSGDPARRGAAALIDRKRKVAWPAFPPLSGKPWPGRLKRLAAAMAGYDLICTYNGGALDAALAHTLFADVYKLEPLIHLEDGSDEDTAAGLRRGRNFYRRIAIGRSAALVVPSRTLERIALDVWQQPRSRVRLIPEGFDSRAFARTPKRDALPGLVKRADELWVGTVAGAGEAEGLPPLVRAFSCLPEPWQLVILGEAPERKTALAEAETEGVEHRVHFPGFVTDPAKVLGLFDLFTLSGSERFPVAQAMAAGLPVVTPRDGDVGATLASENGPFLAAPDDRDGLAEALARLAADPALRKRVGEANRVKARAEYDEATMIDRYHALFWGVMGRR